MSGSRASRLNLTPTVQGPITSFPEDVGWFTAYRKPLEVHARKMGAAFTLRREGEEDRHGNPGDYVVVVGDGFPVLVEGTTFEERYDRQEPAKAPALAPPPLAEEPWTEERKASLEVAVTKLLKSGDDGLHKVVAEFGGTMREYVTELQARQDEVKAAIDRHPTAPSVYACPFCIVQGLQRDAIREHVLKDHIMKGLFGGT